MIGKWGLALLALLFTATVSVSLEQSGLGESLLRTSVRNVYVPAHHWLLHGHHARVSISGRRALLTEGDAQGQDDADATLSSSLATPTHPDVGLDHLFVPLNRTCHADCTQWGNCNIEEGRCECPFGFTGPRCDEPLMPACQAGPGAEPFFGMFIPRSCECAAQANRFFGCSPHADTCTLQTLNYRSIHCYNFTDRPASEQWSQAPELEAPGLEFFEATVRRALRRAPSPLPPLQGAVGTDWRDSLALSLPLERCGDKRCHQRGACIVHLESAEPDAIREAAKRRPHCMCYKGYMGHTCGDVMLELCPNGCRGRGSCKRGFCHCRPPYFGLDCGRERAWQLAPGAAAVPNRVRLRIYVYELPANIAFPVATDDNVFDLNEPSYQTHRKFLELLLRDPVVRTENPHEANLFFVPANAYAYASNVGSPTNQLRSALRYVAQHYPFYNASGGRDHFIWTTGDRGSCYVPRDLSHVIHVTLFGLHAYLVDDANATFLRPRPTHHPAYACYHPRKDVLAAPWYDHMVGAGNARFLYHQLMQADGEDPGRDLLFFFAGSVRPGDASYSGGVREALSVHLRELLAGPHADTYTDIKFVEGYVSGYESLFLRSRFCLAPHGAGFGVRLTLAMTHACVPVIIQDMVYQPYESDGVLPYMQFSLRLSKSDIPHIVPILRSVSPERLRRMRLAMAQYHRAFLWEPSFGGRAYNFTIAALEQRLQGLWGRLWGQPGPEAEGGGGGSEAAAAATADLDRGRRRRLRQLRPLKEVLAEEPLVPPG